MKNPKIPTIKAERTFWEKVTILHHEHHRPENSVTPVRYSRHYYDVFKIGHSHIKEKAFSDLDLLKEVVSFKSRFYPRGWAKYNEAVPGTIKLVPAEHNLKVLSNDYDNMKDMIYGEIPSWDEILDYIAVLEREINSIRI
ncbi:nucleotidyl transferase AbiEii/AbiGii toxin family protein [Candidatus Ruminimicrobium bovinum]|uniref:nucleotidyl transferase AbiEii/AbiGii toxin family protein n=1 Tax=Candidatus Ruminimicrobium bovinum TaxID=3242779 RepID=UPI0039B94A54